MAKMIGKTHPRGPGGSTCACCYAPPGKDRVAMNRSGKRRERQAWQREARADA